VTVIPFSGGGARMAIETSFRFDDIDGLARFLDFFFGERGRRSAHGGRTPRRDIHAGERGRLTAE
jgi:hypothetical protein